MIGVYVVCKGLLPWLISGAVTGHIIDDTDFHYEIVQTIRIKANSYQTTNGEYGSPIFKVYKDRCKKGE